MANKLSRRDVLRGSAATAVGLAIGKVGAAVQEKPAMPPNGRLRFGIIGLRRQRLERNGRGRRVSATIVALADIDAENRSKAMLEHPRPVPTTTYREMLEAMRGKIDAGCDHHSGSPSCAGFCVGDEARSSNLLREASLPNHLGGAPDRENCSRRRAWPRKWANQSTASTAMRKAAALIQSGASGPCEGSSPLDGSRQGMVATGRRSTPSRLPRPSTSTLPLGSGRGRSGPTRRGITRSHGAAWWDFGTGSLGDMGCHIFNMSYMALEPARPDLGAGGDQRA